MRLLVVLVIALAAAAQAQSSQSSQSSNGALQPQSSNGVAPLAPNTPSNSPSVPTAALPTPNAPVNNPWRQQQSSNSQSSSSSASNNGDPCPCSSACGAGEQCCCTSNTPGAPGQCMKAGDGGCVMSRNSGSNRWGNNDFPQNDLNTWNNFNYWNTWQNNWIADPRFPQCGPCREMCVMGHRCCCTASGTRCMPFGSPDCLDTSLVMEQKEDFHVPRKGVPTAGSIHLKHMHKPAHSYKASFTSGLHNWEKDHLITAIVYADSEHKLKHHPHMVLGEMHGGVDKHGHDVNRHSVRFTLHKKMHGKDFIYYRVGVRVSEKGHHHHKQSKSEKDKKTRFYDRHACESKIKERHTKHAHHDDPAYWCENHHVRWHDLMTSEDGWTFSPIMTHTIHHRHE